MGIREVFGLDSDRKVRYAIVGLGDIAQEDMMPAFEHTGNSQITALVTSDATKAKALSELHDVSATFTYADVRVLDGILEALETGGAIKLKPFARSRRIDTDSQKVTLRAVSTPHLVHASNPGRGVQEQPKN